MVTRPDWTGGSFGGVPVKPPHPDATAAAPRATATPTDRVFIERLRLIPGYPEGGITQRGPSRSPAAARTLNIAFETAPRYDGHRSRAVTRYGQAASSVTSGQVSC